MGREGRVKHFGAFPPSGGTCAHLAEILLKQIEVATRHLNNMLLS